MRTARLIRKYTTEQTPGNLYIFDGSDLIETFATIELKWNDNKVGESCIPEGYYKCVRKKHDVRFNKTNFEYYLIENVTGRSYVYIHYANFSRQLLGCIAPGHVHKDIDEDGLIDVTSSVDSMQKLLDLMGDEFDLEITSIG